MKKHLLKLILLCCIGILAFSITACVPATEQYKLNFIVDGEVYHSRTTNGASRINPPIDPEKEGYIFDGWYLDENFTVKYTADYMVTNPISKDTDLYAKWIVDELHTCVAGEWETDTLPTCKDEGRKYKSCTICKREMESAIIPIEDDHPKATTQIYKKQINIKPATCEEKGSYEEAAFCCVCNKKLPEIYKVTVSIPIDNNAHKFTSASLTKNGEKFDFSGYCSLCEKAVSVTDVSVTEKVLKQPTCVDEGEVKYIYSAFGGEFETEVFSIAPLGHTVAGEFIDLSKVYDEINHPHILSEVRLYAEDEEVACGATVLGAFECEECKEYIDISVAQPHAGEWQTVKAPTCYTAGEEILPNCSACGEKEITRLLKATGRHTYVDGNYELIKEGNEFSVVIPCEQDGCENYRMVIKDVQVKTEEIISDTCAVDDVIRYTYKDSSMTVTLEIVTRTGHFLNGVRVCTLQNPDGSFNHNIPNVYLFETKVLICGESVNGYYACDVCCEGDEIVYAKVYRDHSWDAGLVTKTPTCQDVGNIHYTCTEENCDGTRDEEIPLASHNYIWELMIEQNDDTSSEYAPFALHGKCSYDGCDSEQHYKNVSVSSQVTKYPTCSEAGEILYTHERDGQTCTVTAEIGAYSHSLNGVNVDNLLVDGKFGYEYVLSGDVILNENITTSCGNTYAATYTCSECGKVQTAEVYKTHKTVTNITKDPTCTEAGEQVTTCEYAGCEYKVVEPIAATGHSYVATLTNNGSTYSLTATCSVCNDVTTHSGITSPEIKVITAATCCEVGVVEVKFTDSNNKAQSFVATTEKGNHYLNGVDYTTLLVDGKLPSDTEGLILSADGVSGKFICDECNKFVMVEVVSEEE